MKQIDNQIIEQDLEAKLKELLRHYADGAFEGLRTVLYKEVKAVLDNTQQTLDTLRDKHTRQEVEVTSESQRYQEINAAINEIGARADALNKILQKRIQIP